MVKPSKRSVAREDIGMLLSSAPVGEVKRITAIWSDDRTKRLIKRFGLAVGSEVYVALEAYDDTLIIYTKGKRIAIDEELARRIVVS
jgi:Fe2+ transport system protein FeoA